MTDRDLMEHGLTELRAQVEKHQQLMRAVFDGRAQTGECAWSGCPHQRRLLHLLADAVQVLEETRRSFKSRQLEQLRKRFLSVIAEEAGAGAAPKSLSNSD